MELALRQLWQHLVIVLAYSSSTAQPIVSDYTDTVDFIRLTRTIDDRVVIIPFTAKRDAWLLPSDLVG